MYESHRLWCVSKCHIIAILPGRELGVSARRAVLTTNIKRSVTNPTGSVISQQQTVRYKVGNPWNYALFAPTTQDKVGVHTLPCDLYAQLRPYFDIHCTKHLCHG